MDNSRKRISNFHLGEQLYDGARCEVYEARYAQAGGVVQSAVVKVLKPEFACIGEELRGFLREIDWARALRHSLFPRIMEAGEHDGHYFLAMERLDGWTLEALLRDLSVMQVRLPCQVALTLVHQIADGLQSVHEHCADNTHLGVVHLGIEPRNIMMRKDGAAAVFDFGEAMAAGLGDMAMTTHTTAYQAPERLRMLPLDQRADIYSLGKVLENMSTCMDPADLAQDLPALIARACSTHVEERFATMRDFMDAIEVVAGNRNLEFSCHACSRFGSELFGESEMRTDPRAQRPRAAAAPMRMPSEGMATAHGLPPEGMATAPGLSSEGMATAHGLSSEGMATAHGVPAESHNPCINPFIDVKTAPSAANPNEMITEPGGPLAEGSTDAARDSMLVEATELSPKPGFVDEHLAVTAMSAPQTMEELAASQEATRVSTAHIEATAPSVDKPKRKGFPEELVATKVYSQEPDTDDELESAIERLRR